eukprot:TRINITY_DN912_c0_g1_i1.p1 TRINITY_DN912_c0_g1~~TRINITY_DN912_c0_g1_i1.p1  ORF type:complete len:1156 (-),score=216.85 TRINITY_DN912_c0_g1_i1:35-3502(-)
MAEADWGLDLHGPEPDDPDPWAITESSSSDSIRNSADASHRGDQLSELEEGRAQRVGQVPADVTERLMSLLPELGVYSWGSDQAHSWTKPDAWTPRHSHQLLGKRVVHVGAGAHHALCVTIDGELYAFGANSYGQCGGWRGAEYARPVTGFPSRCHIVQADGGISFSAALDSDGRVWTWGRNHVGQLGIGATGTQRRPQLVRGALEGLRVVHISCGSSHMGALTETGHLYMWGWGAYGRLGLGHECTTYHPARVLGILGAETILTFSCGGAHTLCATTDNRLYSWGYNQAKQLGYNPTRAFSNSSPRYVLLREDDDVIQVAGGECHSLALTKSGTVYAWGANNLKQLGLDSSRHVGRSSHIPTVVMRNVVCISAGGSTSAAITKDGDLFTWGKGTRGQRGTVIGAVPTVVFPFDDRLPAAHVAMGHAFAVAVTQYTEIPRSPCTLTPDIAQLYQQVTESTADGSDAGGDGADSHSTRSSGDQAWVDVRLHCQGGRIVKAHKIVLACASNYFRTLLVPELPILADPVQDSFAPTLCSLSEEEDEESLQVLDIEQGGGCDDDDTDCVDGKAKGKDCPVDSDDVDNHNDDDDDESSEAWWRITPAGSTSSKPRLDKKSPGKARRSGAPAVPSSAAAHKKSTARPATLKHKPAFAVKDHQDPTGLLTRRTVDLSLPDLSYGAVSAMVCYFYTGKFTCPDDRDLAALVEHTVKHGPVGLARVASRTFLVRSRLYRLENIVLPTSSASPARHLLSPGQGAFLQAVLSGALGGGGRARAHHVHFAQELLNSDVMPSMASTLQRTLGLNPVIALASASNAADATGVGDAGGDAAATGPEETPVADDTAADDTAADDTAADAGQTTTAAGADVTPASDADGAAVAGASDDTAVESAARTPVPDAADNPGGSALPSPPTASREGSGSGLASTSGPAAEDEQDKEDEPHPLLDERIHSMIRPQGVLFPGEAEEVADPNPGHDEHVVDLTDAINSQLLSDVAFQIEDRFLLGNRAVLSARCPKLRAMFQSGMKECQEKAIPITYASYEVYEAMLQWLYLDHATVIKPDLSPDLLVLADEYGLEDLRLRCERIIAQCLDNDNVISLLCLADRHQAPYLRNECKFYILGAWDDLETSTLASELTEGVYDDLLAMRAQGQPKQGRSCTIL